ncbi:hypothetical protein TSACC_2984 [Terrimicrobium sacchariphilum]|uniref:Uncharacterized protein n=1 Tax=Terrimicrobium sacchariphilum TaxID=690879 RepID=A0A146G459_TERSA|nr:hypothetical protein [Terrimicrobium sacchariphilum]GAT32585.1 hypothetical protein TSACC_2984 [Terrimicrobium sacchariphilum]
MSALGYAAPAGRLDHALLAPSLTQAALRKEGRELRPYPVARVCIEPHAVGLAAGERALLDGARQVDMVSRLAVRPSIHLRSEIDHFLTLYP